MKCETIRLTSFGSNIILNQKAEEAQQGNEKLKKSVYCHEKGAVGFWRLS